VHVYPIISSVYLQIVRQIYQRQIHLFRFSECLSRIHVWHAFKVFVWYNFSYYFHSTMVRKEWPWFIVYTAYLYKRGHCHTHFINITGFILVFQPFIILVRFSIFRATLFLHQIKETFVFYATQQLK
jgi:hypothetical protein